MYISISFLAIVFLKSLFYMTIRQRLHCSAKRARERSRIQRYLTMEEHRS